MYKHFACGGQGSAFGQGANAPYGAFQLLGNLHLQYHFGLKYLQLLLTSILTSLLSIVGQVKVLVFIGIQVGKKVLVVVYLVKIQMEIKFM